ncbi:Z1 domain-containing protein [Bradyrhizobium diazoefficiens]|uniref:Z1 domain-containing protein n=1 Tax=Bradyrhizobium diazoefficiens TaxID=1355477 RepID=UPI00190DC48D|nr:Z1 domain-containing protein [Bradyrhizobium diazoefficiens]MBK3664788.1 Z1 domain-containing protein [Bradyrhizobium diazoefficiens]
MTPIEQTVASMALVTLRQRHAANAIGADQIRTAVQDCMKLLSQSWPDDETAKIVADLETKLVIKVGSATLLVDNRGHVPWYFGDRKAGRRFFNRYIEYLKHDQGWAPAAIDSIDATTDLVMEQLEDPNREGSWDRRGLVVGHVQSGKTANYAALANKAADAGFKLIVVLAGMHNALRQQTQRRLDRDVLGYDTTPASGGQAYRVIGVGDFDGSIHAEHATTQVVNGDFNRAFADNLGMGVQQRPVLLVVKKNARILQNLNTWVSEVLKRRGDTDSRPLLIIDDEADQASVDTGEQEFDANGLPDPDYEPKKINGQIRRLLVAFSRRAYVAYTATPFANVLIHDAAAADGFGDDLFPRSFIVNLPTPSNYVGPGLVFGLDGAKEELETIDCVRHVDQDEEKWLEPGHKKIAVPTYDSDSGLPPSLEKAILAFILACAARSARGQSKSHNSMLIHVSRFKDVHQRVFAQVDGWVSGVKRVLKYRTGGRQLFDQLRTLWIEDFEKTSADVRALSVGGSLPITTWAEIEQELANAADKIRTQVVNSEMRDAIDYDGNSDVGLSIIAIGGDKLSRGLTLEGLTVSYFLRASKMYDSLMQMGRWFGYRPGYIDLCRLYLTPELELWFRHVANAAEELRDRLDHMAMIGSTPESYGLRIQSHEIMLVTAQNKMHHSEEYQVSFAGEGKIQTVFFDDPATNGRNARSVVAFLDRAGWAADPEGNKMSGDALRKFGGRRTFSGVAGTDVASFLAGLEFHEDSRDVNGGRLADYIRAQLLSNELVSWTVVVLPGAGETLSVDGWDFVTVERAPVSTHPRYVIKTVLSPPDEALDLTKEELQLALELTNKKRLEKNKSEATVPDGPSIREVRGRGSKGGLLLLYPLSPKNAGLPEIDVPIFGIVVSFPESKSAKSVKYRFNTVGQYQLLA